MLMVNQSAQYILTKILNDYQTYNLKIVFILYIYGRSVSKILFLDDGNVGV